MDILNEKAGRTMSEPKNKKPRWWKEMDGTAFVIVLCFLFGVYMVVKGIVGVVTGP